MALWKYASLHLDTCKEDTGTQAKMGMDQGFAIPPVRAIHPFRADRSTLNHSGKYPRPCHQLQVQSLPRISPLFGAHPKVPPRVDFDIAGTANSLLKTTTKQEEVYHPWLDDDWGQKVLQQKIIKEYITNEDDALLKYLPNFQGGYSIVNQEVKNAWGYPKGYSIHPGYSPIHNVRMFIFSSSPQSPHILINPFPVILGSITLHIIRYRCDFDLFNQDHCRIKKDVGECQLGTI